MYVAIQKMAADRPVSGHGLQMVVEHERNFEACSPKQPVSGRLIIDGNDLLREMYRDVDFSLDWTHAGHYVELQGAIEEFFAALHARRVLPIVVVDGGGDETLVEELVYRRGRSIVSLLEDRRRRLAKPHGDTRHYIPVLADVVFRYSVSNVKPEVPFWVTDGKADSTIVQLANQYACPVLGCDGNYYVYNLAAGFIHYHHLEWRSRKGLGPMMARVYHQEAFARHFGLQDPDLCLLLPALLGDGCDSIKYIYGAIKPLLEQHLFKCVAVLKYAQRFRNLKHFLESLSLDRQKKQTIRTNCESARRLYFVASTITLEELVQKRKRCPLPLPRDIVDKYRKGEFFPSLLSVVAVHKCPLHYQVGNPTLPPPPAMSKPIRKVTYGLLSGLSRAKPLTWVTEYYRNDKPKPDDVRYTEHKLPVKSDFHELSITASHSVSDKVKAPVIQRLFSTVLHCPSKIISRFDTWEDKQWVLPVAATRFWATSLQGAKTGLDLAQVVKALMFSFISCASKLGVHEYRSDWKHLKWEPTYHAFLQWQCVWYDVVALNQVLREPYEAPSPASLFNGPLALHYATHVDSRIVDRAAGELSAANKETYDKLVAAVLP